MSKRCVRLRPGLWLLLVHVLCPLHAGKGVCDGSCRGTPQAGLGGGLPASPFNDALKGNPLQYSCLENPMDRGVWWAAVHGVSRSRTQLSDSLYFFTFMHWRRKWQPTPVFLPGESQGWGSLVGCRLWGCTESDTTEVT